MESISHFWKWERNFTTQNHILPLSSFFQDFVHLFPFSKTNKLLIHCFDGAFCSRLLKGCTDIHYFICQERLQEINIKFLASHRADAREVMCVHVCSADIMTGTLTLDSGELAQCLALSQHSFFSACTQDCTLAAYSICVSVPLFVKHRHFFYFALPCHLHTVT